MQTIPLCVREGRPGWWGQRKAVLRDRELPDNSQTLRLGVGPVVSPAYDTKCLFLRVSTTCSGSTFQVPATFLSPTLSCSQNLACAQLTFPLYHLLGHLFPIPSAFIQHAAVHTFHENWSLPSLFISNCFKLCLSLTSCHRFQACVLACL